MVPAASTFWAQPVSYLRQVLAVYRLHVEHTSAETAEKRRRKVEDAQKRKEFRRQLGLESPRPGTEAGSGTEYTDFEGKKRHVKKWFGIW